MTLKELLVGFGTQVRSIWMIGLHAFAKRETRMYPEEPVYLPPRYRGRIVLTAIRTVQSAASPVTCVR
ncbi:NADH-quinone oxidoreductase subunit I [Serratia liquefaciens]|nr:NADH-quinone oxidoreductase subunit I [Serratia liquefaciens]